MNLVRVSEMDFAEQAGGLVLEDEGGKAHSRVYSYPEPTEAERDAAWDGLK